MEIITKNKPMVRISYDEMEAYLLLPRIESDAIYDLDEVYEYINKKRVRSGVMKDEVARMVNNREFGVEKLIAKGNKPIDGTDGFYDFNFRLDYSYTPELDENGEIPYDTLTTTEYVTEGQVIAKYTPHDPGTNGMTVTGKNITCKRGRPLPALVGMGFHVTTDRLEYVADVTGRIEKNKNRIIVNKIKEVFSDLDLSQARYDFKEDVIIYGDVEEDVVVYSTGNIIICGKANKCRLESKKDIIVRGGIYGDKSHEIISGRNIVAKHIEDANVFSEGFVLTTVCKNSKITSNDKIYIKGEGARILGGEILAYGGIECDNIGCDDNVRTIVGVGKHRHIFKEYYETEQSIREAMSLVDKINAGLKQGEAAKGNDEKRAALLRTKIQKQSEIVAATRQLEKLRKYIENKDEATIEVRNMVFPKVLIEIDDANKEINEKDRSIIFRKIDDEIICEQRC